MEVGGWLHDLAALPPGRETPAASIGWKVRWVSVASVGIMENTSP
jgi:hypothetical protein